MRWFFSPRHKEPNVTAFIFKYPAKGLAEVEARINEIFARISKTQLSQVSATRVCPPQKTVCLFSFNSPPKILNEEMARLSR